MNDRFTLTRPLGQGSMGTVWLARHVALDIDVALKFIDSSLTKQLNYVERFRREARAAAQIKSPHVVAVLDYGTDQEGRPFMAMEYLEGSTLGALLEKTPRLGPETVGRIISHAARGLSKAHALGVVHRDIKPENLFLAGESEEDGFVLKVLDFGVAKAGFATSGHGTLAGQLIGSPAYMSPEQARSYKSLDHRTDLFSLAVVAYQCLTGGHPFKGSGLGELLLSICTTEPDPPSSLVSGLSPEVDAFFVKALAKKPQERFQNARDMGVAFCDALGLNVASGVDVRSSFAPLSLSNSRDMPNPDALFSSRPLETEATRIISPPSRPAEDNTSSRIQPVSIAEAMNPLSSVPHVLGVALLDHNGECLITRGSMQDRLTFSAIHTHARTVSETVESIESATNPSHLSVRFEHAAIYVRWLGAFTLVVLGDEQLRALLLTVGSNKLKLRLENFTAQLKSVESVSNMLRESGVGLPTPEAGKVDFSATGRPDDPPRPELLSERVSLPSSHKVAALSTHAHGTPARQADAEAGQETDLPSRGFFGFGRERKGGSQTAPQAPQAKRALNAEETPSDFPVTGTLTDTQRRKERLLVHRGKVISGAKPKDEERARKRVIVYRGKVIDEK